MLNLKLKNNLKKINHLKLFQIIFIFLFIIFIIFLLSAKNYTKEYTINKVKITESYNKKDNYYYFKLTYNDITLDMLFDSKYKQKRNFITEIKVIKDDDKNFCLIPKGHSFNFYPICYDNNEQTSIYALNDALKNKLPSKYYPEPKLITTYEDINIYNNSYSYYIWNYDGFYYLNSKENKKIDIFNKEQYTINLIGYTKNYLVIADFDSNYTFNNFYTIELKNGHLKKHKLDRDIYFDSYYPGFIKNKLYIVDNKENAMYEFNAKNGKLEKITSKIYEKGTWKDINIKKLIANKTEFSYKTNYNYLLKDNNLYLTYANKNNSTLVSKDITNIIKTSDEDIFYLKGDELYHYNPYDGETLLLNYFEWNFNSNNMIYIN